VFTGTTEKERKMADSVYKVITLIGTSTESWERAATAAVERASQSLRDLRVAEVRELDAAGRRQSDCLSGEGQGIVQI
jgi:flavin-binding protein dodecin